MNLWSLYMQYGVLKHDRQKVCPISLFYVFPLQMFSMGSLKDGYRWILEKNEEYLDRKFSNLPKYFLRLGFL